MLRTAPLTAEQRYVLRQIRKRQHQSRRGVTIAPMLTDEPLFAWSEIVGFALASFFITIGIGAIAAFVWLVLNLVDFP